MQRFFNAPLCWLVTLLMLGGGCKAASEQTTVKAEEETSSTSPFVCQNCDIECYRKATTAGVNAQIECLRGAIDAAGPGWARAIVATVDIAQAIEAIRSTQISFPAEDPEAGGGNGAASTAPATTEAAEPAPTTTELAGDISMSTWDLLNQIIHYTSKGGVLQPRWLERCVANIGEASESIYFAAATVKEFGDTKSLSASKISDIIYATGKATQGALEAAQALVNCTPGAGAKAMAQAGKSLQGLIEPLGRLTDALGVLKAIAVCGVNVTKGAIVLANNTACLMEDLQAMKASEASLDNARKRILPENGPAVAPCVAAGTCPPVTTVATSPAATPAAPAPARCNGEPTYCSVWAMGVWGEHLRRQFSGALTTRTYFCAAKCGNKGTGTSDCKASAGELFGAEASACGNICTSSQCSVGVDRCISYCCSQDGGCAEAAHQKMTDNNFN